MSFKLQGVNCRRNLKRDHNLQMMKMVMNMVVIMMVVIWVVAVTISMRRRRRRRKKKTKRRRMPMLTAMLTKTIMSMMPAMLTIDVDDEEGD